MLSFWINLYVNASQNNSQGIVLSFYHALHAVRLIQMPAKKEEVVFVFICNGKAEEAERLVSSDWAEKLAESDKGSYFDHEQWLKELNEQPSAECDSSVSSSTCSASRSKLTVEEPLTDLESTETWQKFYGHAIVAGLRLQEKINESVTCRFCQENVELVENLGSKNGLGSIWMFQCQNESYPSHETNLPFPTMEKKQGARDKLCIGSWLLSYRWRSRDSLKGF